MNRLGVDDSFIQKVLRHGDLATTQTYFIKTTDNDKLEAMKKLEAEIERLQQLRASMAAPATAASNSESQKSQYVN